MPFTQLFPPPLHSNGRVVGHPGVPQALATSQVITALELLETAVQRTAPPQPSCWPPTLSAQARIAPTPHVHALVWSGVRQGPSRHSWYGSVK